MSLLGFPLIRVNHSLIFSCVGRGSLRGESLTYGSLKSTGNLLMFLGSMSRAFRSHDLANLLDGALRGGCR